MLGQGHRSKARACVKILYLDTYDLFFILIVFGEKVYFENVSILARN